MVNWNAIMGEFFVVSLSLSLLWSITGPLQPPLVTAIVCVRSVNCSTQFLHPCLVITVSQARRHLLTSLELEHPWLLIHQSSVYFINCPASIKCKGFGNGPANRISFVAFVDMK